MCQIYDDLTVTASCSVESVTDSPPIHFKDDPDATTGLLLINKMFMFSPHEGNSFGVAAQTDTKNNLNVQNTTSVSKYYV